MKNLDAVIDALEVLWKNVETAFERHRVKNLILDLLKSPPKVEQVDATHQKFNALLTEKLSQHIMRVTFQSIAPFGITIMVRFPKEIIRFTIRTSIPKTMTFQI